MAYMPKRYKYRKVMRGQVKGYAQRGNRVSFWRVRPAGLGSGLDRRTSTGGRTGGRQPSDRRYR